MKNGMMISELKAKNIADYRRDFRREFIEGITAILLALAILGTPLMIFQIVTTGWHIEIFIQIFLRISILVMFLYRKRVKLCVLTCSCLGIFTFLSVTSFLQYGLLSRGYWFALMTIFVSMVMLGGLKTSLLGIFFALVIVISGVMWSRGDLFFNGDANHFIADPFVWIGETIVMATTSMILMFAVIRFLRRLIALLNQVNDQRIEIEHMANHDPLTGLPTLRLALDRLEVAINQAKRTKSKHALLYLDLDGFKAVNDTYGHDVGDVVLREVARRLQGAIREGDTACRIGGDEFTVLLVNVDGGDSVRRVCERLINSIRRKITHNKTDLLVGVSIGVALYPDHAEDATALRKAADEVMYRVKRAGKNNFMFVDLERKGEENGAS